MDKFVIRHSSSTPNLASSSSKRPRDEANDQWLHPKRFAIPKPVSRDSDITTSNRFTGLSVDGKNAEILKSFNSASKKKPAGRAPPIVMELSEDWDHQKLKEVIDKYDKNYHLEYKGSNRVKIQCHSPEGHQVVKSGLLNENISFHTYTRRDEKLSKVVIKGLPGNLLDSVADELESLGFPGATTTLIKTSKPVQCPPILVQLPSGTDMSKFKQIKYISSCVITVQRYKTNNKLGTQCYRCQGFGHGSRNCNRPARCVKCSLEHATAQCPQAGFVEAVRCCNCQQVHPANYSKCNERLKYIERTKSKRESFRNAITSKVTRKSMPAARDLTYAEAATSSSCHQQPSEVAESTNMQQLLHPTSADKTAAPAVVVDQPTQQHDVATNEMLQILASIKALKQEFIKCKSFVDKVILILSHVGHYF